MSTVKPFKQWLVRLVFENRARQTPTKLRLSGERAKVSASIGFQHVVFIERCQPRCFEGRETSLKSFAIWKGRICFGERSPKISSSFLLQDRY